MRTEYQGLLERWGFLPPATRLAAEQRLDAVLDRVADGRAHALWLEGAPGVGKTALLDVLTERAAERGALVFRGDCPWPGEGDLPWSQMLRAGRPAIPLELLARHLGRDAPAELFDALHDRPAREARRRRRRAVPTQRRCRAIAQVLALLARRGPLVVGLDDMHRAGQELVGELSFLTHTLGRIPVLWILATERGTDQDHLLPLRQSLAGLERVTVVSLHPLGADELRAILGTAFAPETLDHLVPWLTEKTGGNPLFVREAIRSLEDMGVIAPAQRGGMALVSELDAVRMPSNLETLMCERLQHLPPATLAVLRALAALGGEASPALLQRLASRPAREFKLALGRLLASGLIREGPAARTPVRIRDDWVGAVVLDSFSEPPTEELCRRAAELLGADRHLPEDLRRSRHARALERAGPRFWAQASLAHYEAAREAWARQRQGPARLHVERALGILDQGAPATRTPGEERTYRAAEERILELATTVHATVGPFPRAIEELERLRAQLALRRPGQRGPWCAAVDQRLGKAHMVLGALEEALTCYRRALRSARGAGSARLRARILLGMGWVHYDQGSMDESLRSARRAARLYRRHGSLLDRCLAQNLEGLVALAQSRSEVAAALFKDILKRLPLGAVSLMAAVWNNLGLAYVDLGDLGEARRCFTRARRVRIETGGLRGEAACLINQAILECLVGSWDVALRFTERALRISESLSDRWGALTALANLASVYCETGELEEARGLVERSLRGCREAGYLTLEANLLCTKAHLERLAGSPEQALADARRAAALARQNHRLRVLATALEMEARALADLGRVRQARRAMAAAVEAAAVGCPVGLGEVFLGKAEMLVGLGDPPESAGREHLLAESRESMAKAIAIFERHGALARLASVQGLLETLGLAPAPTDAPAHTQGPLPAGQEGRARIRCFGPLRVVTPCGRELGPMAWGSHKARGIFAYLLLHRSLESGVPREQLLEAIWPARAAETVEKTFHVTLALLRKALAGADSGNHAWATVRSTAGGYRLGFAEEPWIDCLAFEDRLHEGLHWERQGNLFRARSAYQEAERLYEADVLADASQPWADPLRDRYREDYLDLLLRLGALALHRWDPAEALAWADKALAVAPCDDRACRLAMHAEAALGRRRAAADRYRRFRQRLREELGADPEPLIRYTYRQLLAGRPLPAFATPTTARLDLVEI